MREDQIFTKSICANIVILLHHSPKVFERHAYK